MAFLRSNQLNKAALFSASARIARIAPSAHSISRNMSYDAPASFKPGDMKFRNLGKTGLKVSVFSYGGWLTVGGSVAKETTKDLIKCAWEHGVVSCQAIQRASRSALTPMCGDYDRTCSTMQRHMRRATARLTWARCVYLSCSHIWRIRPVLIARIWLG